MSVLPPTEVKEVTVEELGHRPAIFTKARKNAPQAAKAIADVLGNADWVDGAAIVLDWEGVLVKQWNPKTPPEFLKPALYISVAKFVPEFGEYLDATERIDVDDVFGNEVIAGTHVRDVLEVMRQRIFESIEERRNGYR